MAVSTLTIFGAGLIGGSVAHAARSYGLAESIVAVDVGPPPENWEPFDGWIPASNREAVETRLAGTDLVVLCTPVSAIVDMLPDVLQHTTGGVVTDCGSTKATIAQQAASHPQAARFVPGHPMAGHPEGGLKNARADLFQQRKWILCPENADPKAIEIVESFVRSLGADVVRLSAEDHDRSVAVTSHVAQVLASALSVYANEGDAMQAAGPGFASATRVAGGAEAMWRDIFETNAGAIGAALRDIGAQLQHLGEELDRSELAGSLEVLEKARKIRIESK